MININELRRLAQAATPGPWKVGQYIGSPRQFVIHMDVGDKGRGSDVAFTSANFGNDETIANARLIAAANPAAITELLDRLEAAESEALEEARLNGMGSERELALMAKLEAAEKERDAAELMSLALRAKIEVMEKQEPVAWMSSRNGFICKENKNPDYNAPLYALPGAQPAPSAPSEEAAAEMGANGGHVVEAERLAFEAWMRGRCWKLGAKWTGTEYRSAFEKGGMVDMHAMRTRELWAAWRDRAALAAAPEAKP